MTVPTTATPDTISLDTSDTTHHSIFCKHYPLYSLDRLPSVSPRINGCAQPLLFITLTYSNSTTDTIGSPGLSP